MPSFQASPFASSSLSDSYSSPASMTNSTSTYSSTQQSPELDFDILNNPDPSDDFDFTGYYNDFTLFATSESFIDSPYVDMTLYQSLDSLESLDSIDAMDVCEETHTDTHMATPTPSPSSPQPTPSTSPTASKFQCSFSGCEESFTRQCELTRHAFKHTRPFQCRHCGRQFPEKRRCIQHEQTVHSQATDADKTKCPRCDYAQVRPDAVKRHLKLKHGVGGSAKGDGEGSPGSDGSSAGGGKGGRGKGRARRK